MAFNNIQGRADLTDVMLPDQIINEIIMEAPKTSIMMSRAKKARLSAKKAKQPVLATLPDAYWVNGDTGMKQTTSSTWKNTTITAEELAVIVPIPDALIDDADVPLWGEVKPLLVEAIGKKVDDAALFGVDKPESWPISVIDSAIAAGNKVVRGSAGDLGQDVAELGRKLAKQGFGMNGFATMPGMQWELVGLRNKNGDPIYSQSLSNSPVSGLYGYPLNEADNGCWDESKAELLAADWSKFIVGIRQDITFDLFNEGVISDNEGKVILNLMQQDTKALRVVFRVGFQAAVPITRVGTGVKYPAGIIVPSQGAAKSLDDMTLDDLKAYASAHGIDLGANTLKADVVSAIKAAEAK